jgi:hypothetical protein
MIKLSLSKLLTLLIAGFSLILSPMVYGGSGASSAFNATSSTDFANTIEGSENHTSENKIHIFCDSGGADMTSPNQKCVIRLHALIGIKGEISSTYYSKAQITNLDIATPTSSGSKQVTGSAGSFSSLSDNTVATTTPDNYVDTTGTSSMAASLLGVSNGSDTLAGGDSDSGLGADMTADHTVCFTGASTADLHWNGTALATSEDTVATITGNDADNEAVFELTAYNTTEIPRNTIGYADGFAVGYDVTVTSNTPAANASDCSSEG